MLTYTISVSIRSTLLRYSLFFSEYLSNHRNHSTCPDTRPDTINTRPRRRPSVQLETDRPGIEANSLLAKVYRTTYYRRSLLLSTSEG